MNSRAYSSSILLILFAIGLLGAAYSLIVIRRAQRPGGEPKLAQGFFVWPNSISLIITAISVVGVLLAGRHHILWGLKTAAALAVGWVLIFLIFQTCRAAGRKLSSDIPSGDAETQACAGYDLLASSGFFACIAPLIGSVIILAVLIPLPAGMESTAARALLSLAMGFWVAGTFWSLSSAQYRGLLAQDNDMRPADLAFLCVRFRSASGEMAVLATTGLMAASAMGAYHYTGNASAGMLYPMATFGGGIIFGILASPFLRPRVVSTMSRRSSWVFPLLGIEVFLVGTGLVAYFLAQHLLGDPRAFFTFGIGLLTAMLLILSARYRPPFMNVGSPFGTEIAIAEVLMVLACWMLSYRWLGGYGVALCTVGLLSSFALAYPLGALWAIRTAEDGLGEPIDLPFLAHAASRFTEIVMAGGSFLLIVVLFVLYQGRAGLQEKVIDITDPYTLAGLIIGGGFPTLLRSLALMGRPDLPIGSFDRNVLLSIGRWAASRTLATWMLVCLTPMLVAFFWGVESPGAFLVGLAAAELFLILTLWLGEVRARADEGTRWATRATHVLVVGSALVTVLIAPPLVRFAAPYSVLYELWPLWGIAVLVGVWGITLIWRKIRMKA